MRLLLLILSALAAAIAFLPAVVHADVAATLKPTPTPAPCVCDDVLQATIAADDAWLGRCLRASPQLDLSCAQGQTSLTIAATLGHTRLVSLLLGHARAPRLTVAADESAYLPLHVAVQNGHVEVVRLLLARMPPGGIDLQTAGKYTALHFAVESKRKEIVHMLLSQPRPANVNVQEADGATPLILAVDSGDEAIVSLLLQHTPAPHLEYQGLHERVTAFTLACMKGYTGMVRLLLAQRPPPNTEIRSKFQTSAFEAAVTGGFIDIVRILLAHSPAPKMQDARARIISATLMRKSHYNDIADAIEKLELIDARRFNTEL